MKEHNNILDKFLSLLYPSFCVICGERTDNPYPLCEECAKKIEEINFPYCKFCGKPLGLLNSNVFICGECIKEKPSFVIARSGYFYKDIVRKVIHKWKYEKRRSFSRIISELCLKSLLKSEIPMSIIDAITFVPISKSGKKKRGFNQAEDIVLFLSKKFNIPIYRGIQKREKIKDQAILPKKDRLENIKNAFYIKHPLPENIKNLLVIDDVYTTGATLKEITRIFLLHRENIKIYIFTFSRSVM